MPSSAPLALLQPIAGGAAGPVQLTESVSHLPERPPVALRRAQLRRLLGVEFPRRARARLRSRDWACR